jgi:hypothetical protein
MAEVKDRLGLLGAQYANLGRRVERVGRDVAFIARALPHLT